MRRTVTGFINLEVKSGRPRHTLGPGNRASAAWSASDRRRNGSPRPRAGAPGGASAPRRGVLERGRPAGRQGAEQGGPDLTLAGGARVIGAGAQRDLEE